MSYGVYKKWNVQLFGSRYRRQGMAVRMQRKKRGEDMEFLREDDKAGHVAEHDSIDAWVIRLMHRYSSANFKKFMEFGVHPGQFPVLRTVGASEGISLRELADWLHIRPPTVTVTVQRLEKAGFVYKKPDREDQRVSRIFLTEKGRCLNQEITRLTKENEKLLMEGFTDSEKDQIRQFLRRMTENLEKAK